MYKWELHSLREHSSNLEHNMKQLKKEDTRMREELSTYEAFLHECGRRGEFEEWLRRRHPGQEAARIWRVKDDRNQLRSLNEYIRASASK